MGMSGFFVFKVKLEQSCYGIELDTINRAVYNTDRSSN